MWYRIQLEPTWCLNHKELNLCIVYSNLPRTVAICGNYYKVLSNSTSFQKRKQDKGEIAFIHSILNEDWVVILHKVGSKMIFFNPKTDMSILNYSSLQANARG